MLRLDEVPPGMLACTRLTSLRLAGCFGGASALPWDMGALSSLHTLMLEVPPPPPRPPRRAAPHHPTPTNQHTQIVVPLFAADLPWKVIRAVEAIANSNFFGCSDTPNSFQKHSACVHTSASLATSSALQHPCTQNCMSPAPSLASGRIHGVSLLLNRLAGATVPYRLPREGDGELRAGVVSGGGGGAGTQAAHPAPRPPAAVAAGGSGQAGGAAAAAPGLLPPPPPCSAPGGHPRAPAPGAPAPRPAPPAWLPAPSRPAP